MRTGARKGGRSDGRSAQPGRTDAAAHDGKGAADAALELQRLIGNTATARLIQRQHDRPPPETSATVAPPAPAEASAAPAATPAAVDLGLFVATRYGQIVPAARIAIGEIGLALEGVPESEPISEEANTWIAWVTAWIPYLEEHADEPLSPAAAERVREYLADYERIHEGIRSYRARIVADELRRARAAAEAAAAQAERMQPRLDDLMRAAFRSEDEDVISEIANVVGNVIDIGLGLHELARGISEEIAALRGLEELPPVGRVTEGLGALNRALAAINLAFSLTGDARTTELEEGMRQVTVAADAFSALGTLLGAAPHIGLWANLYLVPMTRAIMAQITRLTEGLHDLNRDWAEFSGELLYPGAEPGGDAMFRFMVSVMNADGAGDVPPFPEPVKDYLLEHRDHLEAGAGEEVPTTGWWFWTELDSPRARDWIFGHRRQVWAMFYGSMRVPEPRGR